MTHLALPLVSAFLAFLAGVLLGLRVEWVTGGTALAAVPLLLAPWLHRRVIGEPLRGNTVRALLLAALALAGAGHGAAARQRSEGDCRAQLPEGTQLTVRGALAANWMPPADPKARRPLLPVDASAVEGENGEIPWCAGGMRIRFPRGSAPAQAGSELVLRGEWRTLPRPVLGSGWPRDPGFTGYVSVETMTVAAPPSYRTHPLLTTRGRTERQLHRLMGRHGPLADALLLGRRETLDRALSDRFAQTGLVHLLAISGGHVALIGAVFVLLGRMLRLPPRGVAWLTIVLIALYLAVIGAPASAVRSGIMLALALIATVLQRPSAPLAIVAAAALAIIAVQPMAALDIGFQLSFAGVLGILLLRGPLMRRLPPAWKKNPAARWLAESALVSMAAFATTAPVVAHHFGQVAPVSIIAVNSRSGGNTIILSATQVKPVATYWSGKCSRGRSPLHLLILAKSRSPKIVYEPWVPAGASAPQENEPVFVSGFGAVSSENRSGLLRAGAWVQVRFTAFKDPHAWNDQRVPIAERLDPRRVVWHEIPVGLLPAIHVGQVWKAGELLYPIPNYEYEEFHVLIKATKSGTEWRTGDTCRIVWGSQFVAVDESASLPLIPVDALRVEPPGRPDLRWPITRKARELPGVYCLRIVLPGSDDTLVIPCTEVARYYYANSSNLANSLFAGFQRSVHQSRQPPRHLDEVYNLAESQLSPEGVPHIQLRMRFEKEDAQVAARFRYDDHARGRALAVSAGLQRAEANRQVPLIKAEIPFEGETTLGVHGNWMESVVGEKKSRIFYVFWIEKCTGPWPFSRLTRGRDSADPRPGPVDDDRGGDGGESPPRRPGNPKPKAPKGESIAPEVPSMLTGLRKIILSPPKYDPPGGLTVEDLPVTPSGRQSGWGPAHPEPPTEGVSPQPGTYGKSRRARGSLIHDEVKTSPDLEAKEPRRLQLGVETFRAAVARMAAGQGWLLNWRKPAGDATDPDPVFPVTNLAKKRPAWSYLDRGETGQLGKRRHVLVAELKVGPSFVYLLEAERRQNDTLATLLLVADASNPLDDGVFQALFEQAVARGARGAGIWGSDKISGVVNDAKLVHPHRLTDGATAEKQEEYTAHFAQHLQHQVQKALTSISG